jgi:hypothetical protein
MIVTTLNFSNPNRTVLVLILEKANFERMQKADPVTLESKERGGMMPEIRYPENLSMLVAYEEDEDELYQLVRRGNAAQLIAYLERRRTWQPAVDGKQNTFTIPKGS